MILEAVKIHNTALRMLARREHSCFELKQKLLQRGYDAEKIAEVLQKLMTQNLLSETRFAESYIRSRINKGYGPARIKMELQEKGINKELAAAFFTNNDDWLEKIEHIRYKKFKNTWPQNPAECAKQIRFLQYRGFTLEQINQTKKNYEKDE